MKEPIGAISVIFHEGDRYLPTHRYIVHYLADFWRQDGYEVNFQFGARSESVLANLAFMHVNLSVLPEAYREFAARHPSAINAKVLDISKRRISTNLVTRDDDWDGPVIVKSNLNYAGLPEQMLNRTRLDRVWPAFHRVRNSFRRRFRLQSPFRAAGDYQIFDKSGDVPDSTLQNEHVVVERFLPEIENGLYFCRFYQFLGDRWSCTRMGSPLPIVKASESVQVEAVEPHPEVLQWRRDLGMDYGKLDYVVHAGEPILLDANKTIGASLYGSAKATMDAEKIAANRRALAQGIYAFLR